MEHIRIAVLDQNDNVLSFLDNEAEEATHYYDDELHEYLKGAASTFFFTSLSNTEVSNSLVVGNKLAFVYNGRDYYLNIMRAERDETEVFVEAYSLSFELLNEQIGEYKSPSAISFSQYLETIDPEKTLLLGLNEVSDKKISYEWTGESTLLARLFSLATVFSAEIEFVTNLNENYSLKNITLNVYKEHSDDYQGIGKNQTGYMLRYGVDISGIRKKSDATDVYTSIRLTGKDGLSIAELDKTEYDSKGNIEYRSPKGDPCIRAVQARDRFPSNLMNKNDRYIARYATYDTDNVNVLYGQALGMLKKNSIPQVEYEVAGYADTGIGDTVSIEDSEYKPTLYLEARVSEQVRSFTNSSKNKTIFSNFQEKQSQVSAELLAQMQAMINTNKIYAYSIISSNGVVFKNNIGETTLEASVMDGGKDVTDSLSIVWYKNGLRLSNGKSVVIQANTIIEKAVLRFEAYGTDEKMRGFYEITIMNVDDGKGVTSIDVEYCQSTSPTNPPSGPWLTTAPVWENGKYIWTRTITRYSVGPSVTTNPVCVTGEQGDYGVSATAIQEQYYLSSSSTMQSGGIWGDICPEWVKGKYIWTRSKCSWSNGSTTYTSPVLAQGINTANSNANSAQNTANNAQNTAENANDTANSAQEIANAASVKATNLEANVAKLDTALIGKADIDLANIKNGCITTAMIGTGVIGTTQIADGSITDAKIVGLTANKITAGRLDAAQIEVVNLNAANITVGTINGVQIAPGVITGDKLAQQVNDQITGAANAAQQAQTAADGKNKIYYQNTQPGLTGNKKGDTWFDTVNGYRAYVWNGTAWSLSPFGSGALSDAVNSSITTAGSNASTALANAAAAKTAADQAAKDAQTAQSNASAAKTAADQAAKDLEAAEKNLAAVMGRVNATEEEIAAAQEAVTTAQNKANAAAQAAATAQSTADTAKQNAATAQTKADSAYSLADQAKKAADTAQTSADGKNTVFYQTAQPSTTGRKTGDTWFDTDDGNRIYRWDGSKWTAAPFGTNAIANAAITNALIADATIQSAKIANLDAAKITTGILSADRIAAGSVVFGKLDSSTQSTINTAKNNAQSALNQLSVNAQTKLNGVELFDQTYNGDTTCKPFAAGTYTIVPSTEVTGGNANSGNLIKTVNAQYLYTDYIPVNVDNPFYWCMDAYNLSTNTGTLYIQVCFYDKNKVAVETNEAAINIIGGVSLTAANTWQKLEGWSSVPALTDVRKKAYYARIRYLPRYSGQTGTTYIRNVHWKQLGSNQVAQIESIDSILAVWCYNNDKTYINGGKIYTGTIAATQIAANAIIAGKIAANAVTASTIVAGAVTLDKLAANSVNASKIVAGSITAAQIAANTITGDKIAATTIAAGNLAANSITSDKIVADAITTAKIAAKAVTANEIAAGTITAAQIAANAITTTQLEAGAVTAAKIAAGQITADKIATGAITADKFYGTAITSKNYVANSAGMNINLANGTIDTKNFKVDSAGNVAMTGTLTMQGAQTLKICNNSAVEIASLKYESINWNGETFDSAKLYGKTNVDLAVGSTSNNVECQVRMMAGAYAPIACGQRSNGQTWVSLTGSGGVIGIDPLNSPATYATGCTKTANVTMQNGFAVQVGRPARVILNAIGNFVNLELCIYRGTGGTGGNTICANIPAGYRPTKEISFAALELERMAGQEVWIQPNGNIVLFQTKYNSYYLNIFTSYYID